MSPMARRGQRGMRSPLAWWIALVALLITGLSGFLPPVDAQTAPLVLAFYYAWFDMTTWESGQVADQPLQPYASADPAVIERHVAQAQRAGAPSQILLKGSFAHQPQDAMRIGVERGPCRRQRDPARPPLKELCA